MLSALLREWLKFQIRLGLPVYFRRLRVTGAEHVPASGPILFAANHQNSFLDALMVTVTQHRPMHYLVRSDVFRKPLARKLLTMLYMMPVFRIRDGWGTLGNNASTFNRCVAIFRNGGAVLIFPEGNHGTQLRLRALSRGFTKPIAMALAEQPGLPIQVVPVGLAFSHHTAFRAPASVNYGRPIPVLDFVKDGQLDANALRDALAKAMKQLIVHIEDPTSCEQVTEKLKSAGADLTDPVAVNTLIRSWEEGKDIRPSGSLPEWSGTKAPFRVLHFLPLAGWYSLYKTIRDPMFTGSLKSVYGVFACPLYYLLVAVILWTIVGPVTAATVIGVMALSVFAYRN